MLYPPLNRQYRVIEDFADRVMAKLEPDRRPSSPWPPGHIWYQRPRRPTITSGCRGSLRGTLSRRACAGRMGMVENPGILGDRGKSLEDEFFRKENERAIERLRELKQRTTSRETLAKAIGITNEKIIDRLIELGVRPEIVSALAIVPLVEVA